MSAFIKSNGEHISVVGSNVDPAVFFKGDIGHGKINGLIRLRSLGRISSLSFNITSSTEVATKHNAPDKLARSLKTICSGLSLPFSLLTSMPKNLPVGAKIIMMSGVPLDFCIVPLVGFLTT